MSYLVLARKYRSVTFDEVVGQEAISTTLVNAVKTGRLAQAYLFTGSRGVGKTTMARILAKALNCMSAEGATPTPCNKCDACIAIGRGDDMDVIEIDGASNRGIDEIRELRSNANLRPARARYKVYYIDEVHMLTKEAFNALLKTLEEPPPHVKFIFATTEAEKIPATILSRCQRFDFRNIPTAGIAAHMTAICKAEKIKIDDDAIFRIAKAAAGSMRDGLSLLDQLISSSAGQLGEADVLRVLGTPPEERICALAGAIAEGDAASALEKFDEILLSGYPLEGVATALADQFRNVMLALACGPDSKLIELSESSRAATAALAKQYTLPSSVHAVGVCEQLMRSIRGSSFARAMAEAAVVRLAAADKFVDPASLIERLEQLTGGGAAVRPGPAAPGRTAPGGAPPGAKKKPMTLPAAASAASPSAPAAGAGRYSNAPATPNLGGANGIPAAALAVQWDAAWLTANWPAVIEHLATSGFGSVAGLLRPARPLAVDETSIRLGFPADQGSMRSRAAGAMAVPVAEAMARLAGREVKCHIDVVGEATGRPAVVGGQLIGGISSEQRRQVEHDPAVQAVMELFGGQISTIRADLELARAGQPSDSTPSADGPADEPATSPEGASEHVR